MDGIVGKYNRKLRELSEPEYKAFSEKLNPGAREMLGVRLPALRSLARELAKDDWRGYFRESRYELFEEVMLRGLTIDYIKEPTAAVIEQIRAFLPLVDNWSVCDSPCAGLKPRVKKDPQPYWELVRKLSASAETFYLRWGVVMLMDNFIDDGHIDESLQLLNRAKCREYYSQMAVAWAVSVCFVKFPEKTLELIRHNDFDDFTHNKSIQKIRESLRVDAETKSMLNTMKR